MKVYIIIYMSTYQNDILKIENKYFASRKEAEKFLKKKDFTAGPDPSHMKVYENPKEEMEALIRALQPYNNKEEK